MDKELYRQGKRLIREKIKDYKHNAESGDAQSAELFAIWSQILVSIESKKLQQDQLVWAFSTVAEDIENTEELFGDDPNNNPLFDQIAMDHRISKKKAISQFSAVLEENKDLLLFLGECIKQAMMPFRSRNMQFDVNGKIKSFDLWSDDEWNGTTGKKEK